MIILILKMKKRILDASATRYSGSQSQRGVKNKGSGGRLSELESRTCYFLGDFGRVIKTSVPQCPQLQNEGNKVPPLTTVSHFFKEAFLTYGQ